jgi:glycosyltransferase involved in cell wall biosynthesis
MRAFADYDIVVFPSRRLEAFSLTVVEAQAKGLPVIINPGGGISDTVGDSGIRLQACTPQSLAATLDSVYENPRLLMELQAKGFDNAAKYKLSASKKRLLDLSAELIARKTTK